jgi:uncharacterized membrane protein YtjA (UPF0391 family)
VGDVGDLAIYSGVTRSDWPNKRFRAPAVISGTSTAGEGSEARAALWAAKEFSMLKWAIIFAVVAVIAGVLGFGGIAGVASDIAKFLFFLFLGVVAFFVVAGLFIGKKITGK